VWRGNAYPAAILMAGMVLYGLWVSVSMTSPADYRELLTDDVFLESLAVSSYVAIVSTVLALIIGVVLARLLSRTRLAALLAIPLFIPHLGAAYLAILYLSDMPVIGPHEGNYFSVILTYLYKEIPFVFFYLLPVVRRLDPRYQELGTMLGLSPVRRFWHARGVFLLVPMLEAAFILLAFILFAYEIPALLGVTYPKLLGVYAFDLYTQGDLSEQPLAFAMSVVLTGGLFFLLLLMTGLTRPLATKISRGRSE